MDLMEAIYSRRSVRSYTDKQVEKPIVETLLQAAIQAPSALNQQPWAFAVIQDRKLLTQYSTRVKAHVLKTLKPQSMSRDSRPNSVVTARFHPNAFILRIRASCRFAR